MDILTYAMLTKKLAGKASLVDGKVPASELPETSIDDLSDTAIGTPENGEVLKYDADQGKWVNGTASGGGGTSDYTDLTNKPKINGVTLSGSKTGADLGLVDAETGKGLSTNDFTDAEKTKLSGIESGAEVNVQSDWAQTDTDADDFIKNKPTIPAAQVNSDWSAASGVAQVLNKPTLGTAASKGVDSAPTASSTNLVESGGVASALAGKQDTLTTAQQAAADSGITPAKVTQYDKDSAALPEVVNGGAKNFVDVRFSSKAATSNMPSATNNGDGSITINGTRIGSTNVLVYDLQSDVTSSTDTRYTLPAGRYVIAATGSENVKLQVRAHDGTNLATPALAQASTDPVEFEYDSVTKAAYPYIDVRINVDGSASGISYNNVKFYPMICTKAAWDVSHAYVPYCPSMAELYAMIQALQT